MDSHRTSPPEPICPYLGLRYDPETRYGYPSPGNHCHRDRNPRSINLDYQLNVCLEPAYVKCPIYLQREAAPASAQAHDRQPAVAAQPRSLLSYGWFRLFAGLILIVGSLGGMFLLSRSTDGTGGAEVEASLTPTALQIPWVISETPTEIPPASETPLPPTEVPPTGTATSTPTGTLPPTATPTETGTPTDTPTPTATSTVPVLPPPPTSTLPPPSATLPAPTATSAPPTATSAPPTNTPPPPTNTPVPPTNTPISDVPTNTPGP